MCCRAMRGIACVENNNARTRCTLRTQHLTQRGATHALSRTQERKQGKHTLSRALLAYERAHAWRRVALSVACACVARVVCCVVAVPSPLFPLYLLSSILYPQFSIPLPFLPLSSSYSLSSILSSPILHIF